MQNKTKYGKITNLRAVAIILVVIGHSIIIYSSKWNRYTTINHVYALDRLKDWINLIQMPLFFSISGFLFEKSWEKYRFLTLLRNKMLRLLVPWLCVGFGWMIPIRILVGYEGYSGAGAGQILRYFFLGQDDGHMWFLPALFVCFIIAYILRHAARFMGAGNNIRIRKIVVICIAFGLLRKSYLLNDIGMLRDAASYLFYFETGALLAGMKDHGKARIKAAGLLVFTICSITALAFPHSPYSVAMVMIKTIMVISVYAFMPDQTNRITEAVSRYSFGLYLFHSPLVYITYTFLADANPMIVVGLNLVGGGLLAAIVTYMIRRSPVSFVLGESPERHHGNFTRTALVLGGFFLVSLIFAKPAYVSAADDGTKLHFICVTNDNAGEDSILLESGGRFAFIDCGRWQDRSQIKEAMAELGVNQDNLEFVIGTHAHGDHIGLLNELMKDYHIERFYLMPFTAECLTDPDLWKDTSWQNAMTTADRLGIPVVDTFEEGAPESPWDAPAAANRYTASPHFVFGDAEIDIYNYSQDYLTEKVDNANDCSLVIKVTAGGHTALITGDLSNAEGRGCDPGYDESRIAAEIGHIDILKLPHHGYGWYGTNYPDDLAAFSPSWFIQTGSFDMIDFECDGQDTLKEILRQCETGSRFLATSWYNKRIMSNDDAYAAITIDMTDLSCNISEELMIAAADKEGNIYKFRAGYLTDEPFEGNKTYLSIGRKFDESQIIHLGNRDYAVNRSGLVLNNTVELEGVTYTCNPDNGTCVTGIEQIDAPVVAEPTEIKPQGGDKEIEGAYFADWDRQDMLDALNRLRQDNGVPALSLLEDQTYADLRVLEFAKETNALTVDAENDVVFIPCFGNLTPEEAISRTMYNREYRNIYLGSYKHVACSCLIKPLDIAYATVYAVRFYNDADTNTGEGVTEPDQKAEEVPDSVPADGSDKSMEELLRENNELMKLLISLLEQMLEKGYTIQ